MYQKNAFFIVFLICLSSLQWSLASKWINKMSKLLSKDNLMKKIYADYQWLASYIENMCYKRQGWGIQRERRGVGNTPACSNLDDTLHYYVQADILTEACGTRWRGGTQHHSHPLLVLSRLASRRKRWQ